MNNMIGKPNDIFKPNLKTLLSERTQLVEERKNSKSFVERMKISRKISDVDKQISRINLHTK